MMEVKIKKPEEHTDSPLLDQEKGKQLKCSLTFIPLFENDAVAEFCGHVYLSKAINFYVNLISKTSPV